MDLARAQGVTVRRVTVQSTTLDDVFLHYTGRQLRDEAAAASGWTSATCTNEARRTKLTRGVGATT